MNNCDKISVSGIKLYAYHGVGADEKQKGQFFSLDCELYLPLSRAAESDSLRLTVNYADAACLIARVFKEQSRDLIEAAALDCVKALLKEFPAIERAAVTVHKPKAPIPLEFDDVAVRIERGRENI